MKTPLLQTKPTLTHTNSKTPDSEKADNLAAFSPVNLIYFKPGLNVTFESPDPSPTTIFSIEVSGRYGSLPTLIFELDDDKLNLSPDSEKDWSMLQIDSTFVVCQKVTGEPYPAAKISTILNIVGNCDIIIVGTVPIGDDDDQ